jgi:hypothetical protein
MKVSSLATEARRAIEMSRSLMRLHSMPSVSHAAQKIDRMPGDALVNR